jgi:hypothetical protein
MFAAKICVVNTGTYKKKKKKKKSHVLLYILILLIKIHIHYYTKNYRHKEFLSYCFLRLFAIDFAENQASKNS